MEARAQSKYVRIAPRKARQVMDLIRGQEVAEAMAILRYTPKRASSIVLKLLKSAVANAENNHGMNNINLYIDCAYVDEGPILKRFRPRALGRATRINKRTSHISLVIKEREGR